MIMRQPTLAVSGLRVDNNGIKKEITLFLIGISLTISEISSLFGIEILLTSIIAGIIVQNFSKQGESLISGIELSSLPIYIIFF